jgi:putative Mg2+ transporter-C (MgtC) family protein
MHYITDDTIKLLVALALGAAIGVEREYRNKSAGFRTIILITLGSCLFTILSARLSISSPERIASTIVTGIGFLGAGAIFKEGYGVKGLTTAATIWLSAAIGMAVGGGYYLLASICTFMIVIVLSTLVLIEQRIDIRHRVRHYRLVTLYRNTTLLHYESLFRSHSLEAERGVQSKVANQMIGNWIVTGSEANHQKAIEQLLNDQAITEFDF